MALDLGTDAGYAARLLLAALLGALVGLEREIHDHPAGMRTHLMVSLGSAAFTVLSIAAFTAPGSDPGRIAAQIVSGIGFLGAGAILKEGATIRGLTTAASLWATAAVGMAAGSGAWVIAVTVTVIAIFSLWPLRLVTDRIGSDQHRVRLRLAVSDPGAIAKVVKVVTDDGARVAHLAVKGERGDHLSVELEVLARDVERGADLTAAITGMAGVKTDEARALGD